MTLHQEFVLQVINVTEKLFSSPDIEVELSTQVRKKRHETQLSVFNKLQTLAAEKLEELDSFIGLQVDVHYELFTERVKGVEFSRLLRQGASPSSETHSTGAPATSQTPQFKLVESFLEGRKKAMPWYTESSTSVSAEDHNVHNGLH